jgi:gamma-glutamyltranspeptidase/glutathione hydrolase
MLHTVYGRKGMATAPHHAASRAGLDVLKDGGTAVEAAVAMAATLAVAYPHMNSIGGDGFWLIVEPSGDVHAIDACGRAAQKATLDLYAGHDAIPWRGPLAANTVAGTISGWALALEKSGGTLPLSRLLRDAIALAEEGVPVTRGGAEIAAAKGGELRIQPGGYGAIFEPEGRPLREGDVLRQPALAATLRHLANAGLADFYNGELARRIAADLEQAGSPVSLSDLAQHTASRPAPLHVDIQGARLYNTQPPTQGVASLLILALFDRLQAQAPGGFDHVHGLVEATKQAFLFRDAEVGDPAIMTQDCQTLLNDTAKLDAMAGRIDPARALPWPQPSAQGDTVWFGVADSRGQIVSTIQSTYFEFGSGIVLPGTGITWQNRGSSFRLTPEGWNALKPGRKPFHTLNPAFAQFTDGRRMAYGNMGGEGQPQSQAAVFSRYARFGEPLQQAVSAPRWLLGRTWGENSTSLKIESRMAAETVAALAAAGHKTEMMPDFTSVMGHAGAIVRHVNGLMEGASDPRSDGAVAAW